MQCLSYYYCIPFQKLVPRAFRRLHLNVTHKLRSIWLFRRSRHLTAGGFEWVKQKADDSAGAVVSKRGCVCLPLPRSFTIGLIESGITLQHILDKICVSATEENFQRIHMITKKDLENICREFSLHTEKQNAGDATNVDVWVDGMNSLSKEENPVSPIKSDVHIQKKVMLNMDWFQLVDEVGLPSLPGLDGGDKACIRRPLLSFQIVYFLDTHQAALSPKEQQERVNEISRLLLPLLDHIHFLFPNVLHHSLSLVLQLNHFILQPELLLLRIKRKIEGEVSPHLHGGRVGKPFRKNHSEFTLQDSNLDLPVLGSLAQHETSALANYATEAVHPTEIRTSISLSSAVELNTTSALANYATWAGLIESGITLQHILDLICVSATEENFQRIHMITKKDLQNICKEFSLHTEKQHPKDATDVDEWVASMDSLSKEDNPVIFYKPQNTRIQIMPEIFMSADDAALYEAWENIMGTAERQLLCTWDVDRNWQITVKSMISNKEKRVLVYQMLRSVLQETDKETFEKLMKVFMEELEEDNDLNEFHWYFSEHYASRQQLWAQCYRTGTDINFFCPFRELAYLLVHFIGKLVQFMNQVALGAAQFMKWLVARRMMAVLLRLLLCTQHLPPVNKNSSGGG
uniref:Uncharacterized protein n=1 Tax=Timema genevievae TaxID=629358 RepID=A0A7R9JMS0_TIMGE|nr:unnamed protein product [Timema genevievae]